MTVRGVAHIVSRVYSACGNRLARISDGLIDRHMQRVLSAYGVHSSIPTHMSSRELRTLYEAARACPDGANALEIGSYLGASTTYLGVGLAQIRGRLVCVDTWKNDGGMPESGNDTFSTFCSNVAPLRGTVFPVRKRAEDLSVEDLAGALDLAFIDGDHSYAGAKRDLDLVKDRIKPGALVYVHDCVHFQGVSQVVGEALASGDWQLAGHIDNLLALRRMHRGVLDFARNAQGY
jgi:predicted O-methyltransferase YrrM